MDSIFVCNKCNHHLFIEINDEFIKILDKLSNYCCPACGTNRDLNWRFLKIGDSENELENFKWMDEEDN